MSPSGITPAKHTPSQSMSTVGLTSCSLFYFFSSSQRPHRSVVISIISQQHHEASIQSSQMRLCVELLLPSSSFLVLFFTADDFLLLLYSSLRTSTNRQRNLRCNVGLLRAQRAEVVIVFVSESDDTQNTKEYFLINENTNTNLFPHPWTTTVLAENGSRRRCVPT